MRPVPERERGGKQDRQIAQDFVIGAKETVDVQAFCVEHGRWNPERDGKSTGGSFSASGMLAPSSVRVRSLRVKPVAARMSVISTSDISVWS